MLEVPKIYELSEKEFSMLSELTGELNRFIEEYGDYVTYNIEIAGNVETIIPVCFIFKYYIDAKNAHVIKRLKKVGVPMIENGKFPAGLAHRLFNVFIFDGFIFADGLYFRSGKDCAEYMQAVTLAEFFRNSVNKASAQFIAREKGEVYTE